MGSVLVERNGLMLLKELSNRAQIIYSPTQNFPTILLLECPFDFARTSCLFYLPTHSDCIMTRTSCLLYLYTHSDCIMTRTPCLLYLYTHSDCRTSNKISRFPSLILDLVSLVCTINLLLNNLSRFQRVLMPSMKKMLTCSQTRVV